VFGNTGFGGLLKETTHGTKVRMQENKLYFRKFEGLLQRSHRLNFGQIGLAKRCLLMLFVIVR
ncbi:hypothetical protein, partial [Oligella urethralis]|uniref:hypothetical protein n=1 Tax=Oligella urethralis TaxID=90245 RepID=UPI001CA5DFD6